MCPKAHEEQGENPNMQQMCQKYGSSGRVVGIQRSSHLVGLSPYLVGSDITSRVTGPELNYRTQVGVRELVGVGKSPTNSESEVLLCVERKP